MKASIAEVQPLRKEGCELRLQKNTSSEKKQSEQQKNSSKRCRRHLVLGLEVPEKAPCDDQSDTPTEEVRNKLIDSVLLTRITALCSTMWIHTTSKMKKKTATMPITITTNTENCIVNATDNIIPVKALSLLQGFLDGPLGTILADNSCNINILSKYSWKSIEKE